MALRHCASNGLVPYTADALSLDLASHVHRLAAMWQLHQLQRRAACAMLYHLKACAPPLQFDAPPLHRALHIAAGDAWLLQGLAVLALQAVEKCDLQLRPSDADILAPWLVVPSPAHDQLQMALEKVLAPITRPAVHRGGSDRQHHPASTNAQVSDSASQPSASVTGPPDAGLRSPASPGKRARREKEAPVPVRSSKHMR